MAVPDGERWVSEVIERLRRQTLDNFELIVVDGSTDATARRLRA